MKTNGPPRDIHVVAKNIRARWERRKIARSTVENSLATAQLDFYVDRFSLPADYPAFVRIAGIQVEQDDNMMRVWGPAELEYVESVAGFEKQEVSL